MKLAVISDIHGNLVALDQVLEGIDNDMILCCGDIVGYYTWPNECIERLVALKISSVMGNHDMACITSNTTGFNLQALESIRWTRKVLKKPNYHFLSSLKAKFRLNIDGINILLIHGSPRDPLNEYILPQTPDSLLKSFLKSENVDILIMGHTHIPFVKKFHNNIVLNPGSVGQPRDGNNMSSFSMVDTKKRKATIHRVSYDIDKVSDALGKANLPFSLGKRLYKGQ
ncbi:MAG: metallophosphoesterase family protein [Euryarchaeota archaeon]|nr:metallophosphoesterase family protein [Euryarchaeota archaeon]